MKGLLPQHAAQAASFWAVWQRDRNFGDLLVKADWAEDSELPDLAYTLRWMASRKIAPADRKVYPLSGRPVPPKFRYAWHPVHEIEDNLLPGFLPRLVFLALPRVKLLASQKLYSDEWNAVLELGVALLSGREAFGMEKQASTPHA